MNMNILFGKISIYIFSLLIKITEQGCSYNCREYYSQDDCKSCYEGYYLNTDDSSHYK